jgi:hypothetical protein
MSPPKLSLSKSGAAYVTYRVGKGTHSGGGTADLTPEGFVTFSISVYEPELLLP